MQELDQQLEAFRKENSYPFHMPGHKRKKNTLVNPWSLDFTEITGLDDLHHPKGILMDAQKRAANLYGARESFYLINGSTCGILAGISAVVPYGKKVLVARNCHKSVFHSIQLLGAEAAYIYPQITKEGFASSIEPAQVENAFRKDKDILAFVMTSPTYEGIISDIKQIAEIVHAHKGVLILDEAHGAHLGFHPQFPATGLNQGADLSIMSLHKTLPALTQTGLLHVNSSRVSIEKVKQYLGIYQTSSPSYLLMASIEQCIRQIREEKIELFEKFHQNLSTFYKQAKKLERIQLLTNSKENKQYVFMKDPSKLVLSVKQANITTKELQSLLKNEFNIELEMIAKDYVIALSTIMDEEHNFNKLQLALKEVDKRTQKVIEKSTEDEEQLMEILYREKQLKMQIQQAQEGEKTLVSIEEATGKISGTFLYLYPPGIPMIVPGEILDEQFLSGIKKALKIGLQIEGLSLEGNRIKIVNC